MNVLLILQAASGSGISPLLIWLIIVGVFCFFFYKIYIDFKKATRSGKIKFGSIISLIGVVLIIISLSFNFVLHSDSLSNAESLKNFFLFGGLAFFILGVSALVSVLSKEK